MIAISVVPKLGTPQAVWMPGLDVPRCGPGVGRSAKAETYVSDPSLGLRGIFDRWGCPRIWDDDERGQRWGEGGSKGLNAAAD